MNTLISNGRRSIVVTSAKLTARANITKMIKPALISATYPINNLLSQHPDMASMWISQAVAGGNTGSASEQDCPPPMKMKYTWDADTKSGSYSCGASLKGSVVIPIIGTPPYNFGDKEYQTWLSTMMTFLTEYTSAASIAAFGKTFVEALVSDAFEYWLKISKDIVTTTASAMSQAYQLAAGTSKTWNWFALIQGLPLITTINNMSTATANAKACNMVDSAFLAVNQPIITFFTTWNFGQFSNLVGSWNSWCQIN